jgi:hypothetical protein
VLFTLQFGIKAGFLFSPWYLPRAGHTSKVRVCFAGFSKWLREAVFNTGLTAFSALTNNRG